jgi:hypothetical protein
LRESFRKLNPAPNPNEPNFEETVRRTAELILETQNETLNRDVCKQSAQLGPLIARGARTRAILRAITELETERQLPDGLTAKERNRKIIARIVANGGSVANSEAAMARAIQRAYQQRRR